MDDTSNLQLDKRRFCERAVLAAMQTLPPMWLEYPEEGARKYVKIANALWDELQESCPPLPVEPIKAVSKST